MLLRSPTPLLSSKNLQCLLLLERRFKFKNAARNRSNLGWEHAVEINSATRWIRVPRQALAYTEFKLRTHAHDICAWDLFNNPNPKTETKNKSQTQKP